MKRMATIWITAFLLMIPLVAEEPAQDTRNTRYTINAHTFQVNDTAYAHPRKLTVKQVARMLSALRTMTSYEKSIPLFSAEEQVQLSPEIVEQFSRLETDQQVEVVRQTALNTGDSAGTQQEVSERVYMCFLDAHTLYVAVITRGSRYTSQLKVGNYMAPFQKTDGTIVPNIVLLLEELWTTSGNRPIFEKSPQDALRAVTQMQVQEREGSAVGTSDETPVGTLTMQELETELQKLKDLLDKELISRQEFETLRKDLMKRAGIGGSSGR